MDFDPWPHWCVRFRGCPPKLPRNKLCGCPFKGKPQQGYHGVPSNKKTKVGHWTSTRNMKQAHTGRWQPKKQASRESLGVLPVFWAMVGLRWFMALVGRVWWVPLVLLLGGSPVHLKAEKACWCDRQGNELGDPQRKSPFGWCIWIIPFPIPYLSHQEG